MLKNDDIFEEFKKSLSITIKSIGKNNDLEINFIKDKSSINGNAINLKEPNIESFQKNSQFFENLQKSCKNGYIPTVHRKKSNEKWSIFLEKCGKRICLIGVDGHQQKN